MMEVILKFAKSEVDEIEYYLRKRYHKEKPKIKDASEKIKK